MDFVQSGILSIRLSNSGFCPFGILSNSGFCPFVILSNSGFCPFVILSNSGFCPIRDFVRSGFCPFGILSNSGFCPFRILSNSGFCPFVILSNLGFCTSEFCPILDFAFWDFVRKRHFFECCSDAIMRRWALQTCYKHRRNTASTMKDLILIDIISECG